MDIRFLGAAGEVTGSCYLLTTATAQVLLECGQIQGSRASEQRNRADLPFDIHSLDAVVLSHAHIDHSGRLPLLSRQGYTGPVYTHSATRALCEIMLRDSAYLHEKDAEWENRKRQRRGESLVKPLFTRGDAETALTQFVALEYGTAEEIAPGVRICLRDAGHILGAAVVEIWLSENGMTRKLVFSGDLGYHGAPVITGPDLVADADLVLMESTYGDRLHRSVAETERELAEVFAEAERNKGNIIIPAFAVGRTQDVLYLLARHFDDWGIGAWRVYLDSPMAIHATEIYSRFRHLLDAELFRHEADRPALANVTATRTSQESMAINQIESGAIIIAGSGMCTGGRVVHHLKHNLWKSRCHIVIVGFQAGGTLGRQLVDGAEYVRILGEEVRVNARIHTIGGLSAHADQAGLIDWYRGFSDRPPVCLVHGEPAAQAALAGALREHQAAWVRIPGYGETLDLGAGLSRRYT